MIIIIIIIIIVTFIIINSPSELNSYSFNGLKFYLRRGGGKKIAAASHTWSSHTSYALDCYNYHFYNNFYHFIIIVWISGPLGKLFLMSLF